MDNRERKKIIKSSFYVALAGQSGVLSPSAIVEKAKEVARLAPEALAEILSRGPSHKLNTELLAQRLTDRIELIFTGCEIYGLEDEITSTCLRTINEFTQTPPTA